VRRRWWPGNGGTPPERHAQTTYEPDPVRPDPPKPMRAHVFLGGICLSCGTWDGKM